MKLILYILFSIGACNIYDSYTDSNFFNPYGYGQYGYNPLFPTAPAPFGWPQYGTVTPWSSGGLFGLTRATGHSDRYGGNLGYNYGCTPFCQFGGGLLGR